MIRLIAVIALLSGCQYQPIPFQNGEIATPPQGCLDARERGSKEC